jgi:hypothetical protein
MSLSLFAYERVLFLICFKAEQNRRDLIQHRPDPTVSPETATTDNGHQYNFHWDLNEV